MKKKEPSKGKSREPNLPDSELEIMRVLWDLEEGTTRQVWDAVQKKGSTWTYATVNTLLQRLEVKGLVVSNRKNMTYLYTPKVSRQQVVKKRVKQLVDKLYDGKSGPLVMHLLKSQRLSNDERSAIRDLLTEHDGNS